MGFHFFCIPLLVVGYGTVYVKCGLLSSLCRFHGWYACSLKKGQFLLFFPQNMKTLCLMARSFTPTMQQLMGQFMVFGGQRMSLEKPS